MKSHTFASAGSYWHSVGHRGQVLERCRPLWSSTRNGKGAQELPQPSARQAGRARAWAWQRGVGFPEIYDPTSTQPANRGRQPLISAPEEVRLALGWSITSPSSSAPGGHCIAPLRC